MHGGIWDRLFSQKVINGQNGLLTLTQNFQLWAFRQVFARGRSYRVQMFKWLRWTTGYSYMLQYFFSHRKYFPTQIKLTHEYIIYFQERFLKIKLLNLHSTIASLILLIKSQIIFTFFLVLRAHPLPATLLKTLTIHLTIQLNKPHPTAIS